MNFPFSPVAGVTLKNGEAKKLIIDNIKGDVSGVAYDANGTLLFYTDGQDVWDGNHQRMPHGTGLRGLHSQSRVQVVPKPGDPTRYFIFTTHGSDNWVAPDDAARYSEVDLCLNGGSGDVIEATKNTALVSIAAIRSAVVRHRNGIDYWVAFHKWQSNQYYCYKVTSAGVDPTPVISAVGINLGFSSNATGDNGEMKFSANGKKLAMAVGQFASVEVVDFNDATGVFSNAVTIPAIYRQNYFTPDYTHGVEFSPNGKKLYVSRTNEQLLTQYDVASVDQSTILKSRKIISGDTLQHSNRDYDVFYGLQLGIDGRLYTIWAGLDSCGIGVIEKPNEVGSAVEYHHKLLQWDYASVEPHYLVSFPTFPADYFLGSASIISDFNCINPRLTFQISFSHARTENDVVSVLWNFDDPLSGTQNASSGINPSHTFSDARAYDITCLITWTDGTSETLYHGINMSSLTMKDQWTKLPKDTTLCVGTTLKLDPTKFVSSVKWQDGTQADQYVVTKEGDYWFTACIDGCVRTDSITVDYEDLVAILPVDTTLCESNATLILDTHPFDVVKWFDNTSLSTVTISQPGTYWVDFRKGYCKMRDSIKVAFCEPEKFVPNIVTANGDGFNDAFLLEGFEGAECSVTIVNRYGVVVYQTESYLNDWNGDGLASGVYFYRIEDRRTQKVFKGTVQVVR